MTLNILYPLTPEQQVPSWLESTTDSSSFQLKMVFSLFNGIFCFLKFASLRTRINVRICLRLCAFPEELIIFSLDSKYILKWVLQARETYYKAT